MEVLLEEVRGELDEEDEHELEEMVLLFADEVLTFEDERGELEDDELFDIILRLLEDCEELLLEGLCV
ncbi:MAG: hypothetical protein IKG81_13570 [Bacteroidales bacterium]|nr:hypothetical protein [Bacteroidales bacterium]